MTLKNWVRQKDFEETKIKPIWEDSVTGHLLIVDNRHSKSRLTLAFGENQERVLKSFRTKTPALKFAKSFMRKH